MLVLLVVADLVGSARLVAVTVTVTVWGLVIEAGAVYRPAAVMLPTSGLTDQVTLVLTTLRAESPEVLAENCCVCRGPSETEPGETTIADATGARTACSRGACAGAA